MPAEVFRTVTGGVKAFKQLQRQAEWGERLLKPRGIRRQRSLLGTHCMLLEVAQLIDGDLHDGCLLVDSSQHADYSLCRLLPDWLCQLNYGPEHV